MNLAKEMENDPILQFAPFALTDIKSNWNYLSEQNEEVAKRTIEQIMDKCKFLSQNPKLGRERSDLILNMRQFPFKNFNIIIFPSKMVLRFIAFYIVPEITSKFLTN